ncbi:uncharacterized protein EMH_0036450 [Eimeria mitis]|uniref:Uncharacterized protein n=1 Tax=Eimeria mitis TaxID=44415 RepID=U6JWR9_9EIME|nr:uncharacterized protein EMH_0036450 [Eimeria mitis]CDJ27968.1 hypothetical protein EMH_0036450 [Eimeria mitis]
MNFLASQRLQDDDHSPPSKVPRLNGSPPSTSHPQEPVAAFLGRPSGVAVGDTGDALDADVRLESELVVDEVEHQRHTTGLQRGSSATAVQSSTFYAADAAARPSPSSFVSRADSAEEGVTPDAWLDESLAETGRVDHQTRQADLGRASAVPSTPLTAVQHLEHSEQGFDARVDVSERSALPAVPGTSSEGGEPCDAGDICLHPFVRLPVVNPENIRRKFRKDFALVPCLGKASPMDSYMILRDLFSKPSLTAVDIDKLLQETEMLANYATTRLARTYGRCTASYLVRKLSTLFMLFDHLVCSIELLGENMDTPSWWPEFVRKFSTEYHLPLTGRTRRERELSRLVNRLSSALATYKEGKRPPFREIIELKRTIIAEASAESQLTNPLWELWMAIAFMLVRAGRQLQLLFTESRQ